MLHMQEGIGFRPLAVTLDVNPDALTRQGGFPVCAVS